jgi:hypothetical protein
MIATTVRKTSNTGLNTHYRTQRGRSAEASTLYGTYNRRTGAEQTTGRRGLRPRDTRPGPRPPTSAGLRLVIAVNYERGDNPGSTIIME